MHSFILFALLTAVGVGDPNKWTNKKVLIIKQFLSGYRLYIWLVTILYVLYLSIITVV